MYWPSAGIEICSVTYPNLTWSHFRKRKNCFLLPKSDTHQERSTVREEKMPRRSGRSNRRRGRRGTRRPRAGRAAVPRSVKSLRTAPTYSFTRQHQVKLDLTQPLFAASIVRIDRVAHGLGPTITAASIPGFSEFAALFGGYKINAIKYTITPNFNNTFGTSGAVSAPQVLVHRVSDPFNHLGMTPSIGTLNEFQSKYTRNLIESNQAKSVSVYFKPVIGSAVEAGALTSTFSRRRPQYVSTSDTDVDHFGPAIVLQTTDGSFFSNNDLLFSVSIKYYMSFKNVR